MGCGRGYGEKPKQPSLLVEAKDSDGDGFPDWWEEEYGLDPEDPTDAQDDTDDDGLPNRCEWNNGTNPNNPDTDGGGQSDGSEMPNCTLGRLDPLDPNDDQIKLHAAVLTSPEAMANGTPYVNVWLEGKTPDGIKIVDIYRRPTDQSNQAWVIIADGVQPPTFLNPFQDTGLAPGSNPQYRIVPHLSGKKITTGASLTTAAVKLSSDPYPPAGSIIIAEGEQTTNRYVTLFITAQDNGHNHGELDHAEMPPGTPQAQLEMRLSTNAQFLDTPWQPFQPIVDNFDLGELQSGDTVTVYVRFRDRAGNISDGYEESATITFIGKPQQIFLPMVVK